MARVVLVDSSALVAALDRRDRYHAWARTQFGAFDEPCLTCDAVLSETFFLLGRFRTGQEQFCTLLERGIVHSAFPTTEHLEKVLRLMRRYAGTPMSFADACLVRMSELEANAKVFTLDSDFRIYRRHDRHAIPMIAPWL